MLLRTLLMMVMLLVSATTGIAQEDDAKEENLSKIDIFMKEVLKTRLADWRTRQNYMFREIETFDLQADSLKMDIYSLNNEYNWYVKDGYLVRCLAKIDGVELSREEQERKEKEWIERRKEKEKEGDLGISAEDFFGFDFTEGSFYFKGKDTWQGREVLVVEYYTEVEIGDELEQLEDEDRIDKIMENSVYNTLWILPEEKRIVKMRITTSDLDFLPGRWLIQVDSADAVMEMTEPFPGIWCPASIRVAASSTTAQGPISFTFQQTYSDFRQAEVKVNFYVEPDSIFNRNNDNDETGEENDENK